MRRIVFGIIASVLLVSLLTALGQNTNAPRFLSLRKTPRTPIVLEWAGDPLTVYRIEAANVLGPLAWEVAQIDFPAQGTNTFWTDNGSDSSLSPRLSSAEADAPYRFYRLVVERYMSNAPAITVTINNVSEGASLSGANNVLASASASQGIASAKLYVDGDDVNTDAGTSFVLPLETRFYPNGTHRLSVVAIDAGALESTEADVPESTRLAAYGTRNLNVTFTNFLSNVRFRYKAFRPDLGQTQRISGTWSLPRLWRVDITTADRLENVFRSFTGQGSQISVTWDGTDAFGGQIDPQVIGYRFYDLGPGSDPAPSPGGGDGKGPPIPGGASLQASAGPSSAVDALLAGLTSYFIEPPPLPPPLEELYGPLAPVEVEVSDKQQQAFLTAVAKESSEVNLTGAEDLGPLADANTPRFSVFWTLKRFGTMGVLSQGHHPRFGSYPPPSRGPGLGSVRMSSRDADGPWGPLFSPSVIASDCSIGFPSIGYQVLVQKMDDNCRGSDLRAVSQGGSNVLNQVNIGLFVGHSVAGRDQELSIGHLQSYVPIYDSTSDAMDFVKLTEMIFGSPNLSWMAFYSCNLLRDSSYRTNGIYDEVRNHFALPMNTYLHALQAYATENTVHPSMVYFWTQALSRKSRNPTEHTVLGAWRYVCLTTQPKDSGDGANVSRSVYWPECVGDYIYGWGPQTEPDRDPEDPLEHVFLLEDDQRAPAQ